MALPYYPKTPGPMPKGGVKSRTKGLLKDQPQLTAVKIDGKTRWTIKPLEDDLSFDKGFYVFIRAVQQLVAKNTGTIIVGLAGPSGAGKTVFSQKIQNLMPGCAVLSMDMYNDATRLVDGNFDDPRLTDYDLLLANIADLRDGQSAQAPIYDFKSSTRTGFRQVDVPKSRVVIIEGIYALSTRIRPMLDLMVSIKGGVHFDLVKRVLRDIQRSGQAPEEIIQQISDTVYPMYKAFIEPDLAKAHLRISNTFNPFSGFMDATYILKSAKYKTVEDIRAALPGLKGSGDTANFETFDIYLLPPGEDIETCASWLRMRNREGRYQLMFEEWVVDGPFIITPRISFEVSVRILGGLMALGYEIGTIMKRTSTLMSDGAVSVKLDNIEGMTHQFIQVQGKNRELVAETARKLGLDGSYIPRSYIEQVQLEQLTSSFQSMTEDLRQRLVANVSAAFPSDDEMSPLKGSFQPVRTEGFALPERPAMASSAPVGFMHHRAEGQQQQQPSNGLLSQQMRGPGSEAAEGPALAGLGAMERNHARGSGPGRPSSRMSSVPSSSDNEGADAGSLAAVKRGSRGDKLEKLLMDLGERMESLTLVPDIASAQISQQLQAILQHQEHLSQQLQQVQSARQLMGGQGAAVLSPVGAKPIAGSPSSWLSSWGPSWQGTSLPSLLTGVAVGGAAALLILRSKGAAS